MDHSSRLLRTSRCFKAVNEGGQRTTLNQAEKQDLFATQHYKPGWSSGSACFRVVSRPVTTVTAAKVMSRITVMVVQEVSGSALLQPHLRASGGRPALRVLLQESNVLTNPVSANNRKRRPRTSTLRSPGRAGTTEWVRGFSRETTWRRSGTRRHGPGGPAAPRWDQQTEAAELQSLLSLQLLLLHTAGSSSPELSAQQSVSGLKDSWTWSSRRQRTLICLVDLVDHLPLI